MITETDKKSLSAYFKTRRDIAFAFLFGSQARGNASKLSDIDIAVYLYPEKRHPIGFGEKVSYEGEDEGHPLAPIMELVGILIEKYETEYVPELS